MFVLYNRATYKFLNLDRAPTPVVQYAAKFATKEEATSLQWLYPAYSVEEVS